MNFDNDYPLVTFMIKESQYAISAKYVSNMVTVPPTRPVPHAPAYVRGIINLRGKTLPLVDLRLRLGFTSSVAEIESFCAILGQSENDHKKWLKELESSVTENREFSLTTDPHQCAFGKWYDTYQPNDLAARAIRRKFARPHNRIHDLARRVKKHQVGGDFEGAKKIIAQGRAKDLQLMIKLFNQTKDQMVEAAREIAMIVETAQFEYAVAIDMVTAVEFLKPGTIEKLPVGLDNGQTNNLVGLIGRRQTDNSSVQILDSSRICDPDDVKGLIVREESQPAESEPIPV